MIKRMIETCSRKSETERTSVQVLWSCGLDC